MSEVYSICLRVLVMANLPSLKHVIKTLLQMQATTTQYLARLVSLCEEWPVGTHALDNSASEVFLSIWRQGYATGLCRRTPTIASN
jgi:hypothetical protein